MLVCGWSERHWPTVKELKGQGVAMRMGDLTGHLYPDMVQDTQCVLSSTVRHSDAIFWLCELTCKWGNFLGHHTKMMRCEAKHVLTGIEDHLFRVWGVWLSYQTMLISQVDWSSDPIPTDSKWVNPIESHSSRNDNRATAAAATTTQLLMLLLLLLLYYITIIIVQPHTSKKRPQVRLSEGWWQWHQFHASVAVLSWHCCPTGNRVLERAP